MKVFIALALLGVISQSEAIQVNKKFKIGDEFIDFDEEAEYKEQEKKEGPTLESLFKADNDMLVGFDETLASAQRNIGKGELNIEMGKA